MDQLADRWTALVQALESEFTREGGAREVVVSHDLRTLRLRARRPLPEGREEWITVTLTKEEILARQPEVLAREFARAYYACT
jgi:hypothetical protein